MNCSNCGGADDGFRSTLKGSELAWIEDDLGDGEAICKSCAHELADDAWVSNRQYQESRDIHEDGHWDGENFYPSAG